MADADEHASRTAAESDPAGAAALLLQAQQLAAQIQHEINNPLAALLAESQILQDMLSEEKTDPELREGADRIVELTRRVIGKVRELDAVRGDQSPP